MSDWVVITLLICSTLIILTIINKMTNGGSNGD